MYGMSRVTVKVQQVLIFSFTCNLPYFASNLSLFMREILHA